MTRKRERKGLTPTRGLGNDFVGSFGGSFFRVFLPPLFGVDMMDGSDLLFSTLSVFMVLMIGVNAIHFPNVIAGFLATIGAVLFIFYAIQGVFD